MDLRALDPSQLDAMREIANIGAGHAATALSQMTHRVIMIDVPEVSIIRLEDVGTVTGESSPYYLFHPAVPARFAGRRLMMALLYTGMGFPPVVIGLFVYLFLSRSGPLGVLGWLFTPKAMVVAQTAIALLRQQMLPSDRVHGIVTKGGDAEITCGDTPLELKK